ncbi:MAG: hypothetical protein KAS75_01895 [Planctomycetes bacterium]|nr:hypothetical protein [Planctomycetota bacterium]
MRTEKKKTVVTNLKLLKAQWFCIFSLLLASLCFAVTSEVTHHTSGEDLLKGQSEDVVVGSQGTIQLGRAAEVLIEKFSSAENAESDLQPWSVNTIVSSGGTVYIGTSPNGAIFKYRLGKLTKIYPEQSQKPPVAQKVEQPSDVNAPGDANAVEIEQYLSNKHIFAMAEDISGRLLAGVSGEECKLIRFETDEPETIFEPNDAKYILAITVDEKGDIYLGTGPEGKVYKLDSLGRQAELIYTARDKNILSLAVGKDGFLYAGSDNRGLIYKIDPQTKTATVLYDSEQPEITSLLFAESGDLYAAATSAQIVKKPAKVSPLIPLAGRPEKKQAKPTSTGQSEDGLKLQVANTKRTTKDKPSDGPMSPFKPTKSTKASYIYKVTADGFVTDIFDKVAVFFALAQQDGKLLVGTGNDARLFAIDPVAEEEQIIYEDQQASQITVVVVSGDDVYVGTSNPAKVIKLAKTFAEKGSYTSKLIDAGQPARWGKLQIEADIPEDSKVLMACRSGNVDDVNDPTFSDWTKPVEVTEPVQLGCPVGRFCQYKLTLQTEDKQKSPVIREIAIAHSVDNLAPKVEEINVSRIETKGKIGTFKISYKARDDNKDKLIYKIDFRKAGRTSWIKIEEKIETGKFEWNSKTVEDGRYEIRVTASDERSNTVATKLEGSRISEHVVVDNTGPVINGYSIEIENKTATLKLQVSDELSAIGNVSYAVDSNDEWTSTLPDDLVYDTIEEGFTIVINDLGSGEHVIALKVSDDLGNTTYKTFEVNITSD